MPATKIQDEAEVKRWFAEGRTYDWMSEQYRTKYNLTMTPSAWSNFRRRHGLARRIVRDEDLIPWNVQEQHRWAYPLQMLRMEARARAGEPIREADAVRHRNFIALLERTKTVIHYDPDTDAGFHYVPRLPTDTDIVRRPGREATKIDGAALAKSTRTARHAAD